MLLAPTRGLPVSTKIQFSCDKCHTLSVRTLGSIRASWYRTKSKTELCTLCSKKAGAAKRPQNNRNFLRKIGTSKAYYLGIKARPSIRGTKNPMYGKKHTQETKRKMSIVRTGKVGEKATAWKGGKLSFNSRIKSAVQRRWKWFSQIFDRDKKCTECGATKKLDAHHIIPLSNIIKQITKGKIFEGEAQKYEYVVNHPKIKDTNLQNGIALCRKCHKEAHQNWGSHEPKVCQ